MPECLPVITHLIGDGADLIVGATYCKYTTKAIERRPGYYRVFLDEHTDSARAFQTLQKKYNHFTVPFVFRNGRFIGGSDSLF
jgi:glutaredoxin